MKNLISVCLFTVVLAVSTLPAHADPGKHSSQKEHREHHREQVLSK
jgi:hypothetical protein